MGNRKKYKSERREIARMMSRLYRVGLTTTSGGNVSLKITEDVIAITASATDKGRMKWEDVGLLSLSGKNLTPGLKLSIESGMHLAIYRSIDAYAIVHAHPVFATAFTASGRKIDTALTAEARAILGEPLFVPYALMGSKDLADIVAQNIRKADILLLENHGILTVGSTLLEAFDKIEVLENAAKMTVIVEMIGEKRSLSEERISELEKLFR